MSNKLHVHSEIGPLKTVVVKRPDREVDNLIPDMLQELLFDDIPYLPQMQEEHDAFAEVMRANGSHVLYIEELAAEAFRASDQEARQAFVEAMIQESQVADALVRERLKERFLTLDADEMIAGMVAGVVRNELDFASPHQLESLPLFLMKPMPNLYFTRDIASAVGEQLSINNMTYPARQRETLLVDLVARCHPEYRLEQDEILVRRDDGLHIEGGDILVLSEKVLAIGISQRTTLAGAKAIAQRLFEAGSTYEKVLAIEIPNVRAMMHLDTVFTMVDRNLFTMHAGIRDAEGRMLIHVLEPGDQADELRVSQEQDLEKALREALEVDEIVIIPCGNGHPIDGPREQWNDGSNTLAIAPGKVITYNRNNVTNGLLRKHGVEVFEIPSSELSRGRGGPRCMSMPLYRERI